MRANRRDFSSDAFSANPFDVQEEADPRVGLVNLADVMLVLACGLMVALVVNWNINLPSVSEITDLAEMTELSDGDIDQMTDQMQSGSGSHYQERGMVYEDPTTGKLYLLEQSASSSESSSGAGSSGSPAAAGSSDVEGE